MSKDRPNIFSFHEYRPFLKEWFSYMATIDKDFSMRQLAKRASLSCAYLPYVLQGKRKLSHSSLQKLIPHLGLLKNESEYLENLRTLCDAKNHQTKLETLKKIQKLKNYTRLNIHETEAYRYLTHWYYVTIREMVNLDDFQESPKWICDNLNQNLSEAEAKEAFSFLTQNGYLTKNDQGKWVQTSKQVNCMGGVYSLALNHFHREVLSNGIRALETVNTDNRHISGYTLSYSKGNFSKVREILEEATDRIARLEASVSKADTVYHVSLYAFPMTKKPKRQRSGGSYE